MNLPKYNIRHLLVLTVVACVAAALIADEPAEIGLATVFCAISFSGIATLILVSLANLWRQMKISVANRSLRPLISRIKWLIIETIILVWLFATISITNYVLANHVKHAPWLLLIGAVISPVTARKLALRFLRGPTSELVVTVDCKAAAAEGKERERPPRSTTRH